VGLVKLVCIRDEYILVVDKAVPHNQACALCWLLNALWSLDDEAKHFVSLGMLREHNLDV
jgi:hypothetical protein